MDDAQTGLMCPTPALCFSPGQQSMHVQSLLEIEFNDAPLLVASSRICNIEMMHMSLHFSQFGWLDIIRFMKVGQLQPVSDPQINPSGKVCSVRDHSGHNFAILSHCPAFSVVLRFQLALRCSALNQDNRSCSVSTLSVFVER